MSMMYIIKDNQRTNKLVEEIFAFFENSFKKKHNFLSVNYESNVNLNSQIIKIHQYSFIEFNLQYCVR